MFHLRCRQYLPLLSLILLTLSVRPAAIPAQSNSGIRIRVMSLNLRHGEKPGGKSNLPDVISLINRIAPDIVLIQEVDRNVPRSSFQDQPRILAEGTGMFPAFTPTLPSYRGGEFGLLVLSRTPPAALGKHTLPYERTAEPRPRILQEHIPHTILPSCSITYSSRPSCPPKS